ncbi:HigA family addiction module antitoxin [Mesorhizobium sp. VK24D]|uniref:HigA family addiction module antitoxin n=1 Tax=Mesorhizobium album TaxID=3072314 RepID=A0ABU4Y177_9HYPH|nr:HigA family addiction module antitoxin [Mesorhizobium sp. VK24D]MDX8480705.1 HigA family addiction module antitoxin [Mesorhizobium sp. VK24D]
MMNFTTLKSPEGSADIAAVADPERCPSHPGELVADLLEDAGKSKLAVAGMLGISRQQFHAILAGRKPVTPDMAARLGKLFGNGPGLWLRMQASYDAWHAAREVDVSRIPYIAA